MSIPSFVKDQVKKAPIIRRLIAQRDGLLAHHDELSSDHETIVELRQQLASAKSELAAKADQLAYFGEGPPYVPNGHYYSPIHSQAEVARDSDKIFGPIPASIAAVDLNTLEQQKLLSTISSYYADLPFTPEATEGLRYHYENRSYSYSDGIFLNGMIRHLKPARVIEIGSGYTSGMFLDTNERWFNNAIHCTFIEPYPDLLYSLLKEGDIDRVRVIPTRLQDVELSVFAELEANDILFVDSTHVGRVGSDVNYIFFQILPLLKPGVHIHFHDVFYPFEYPKKWILEGRAWNELYLLRAFLQYNSAFKIVLFNTYLEHLMPEFFEQTMPLCMKNKGGSIWLRKC